MAAAADAVAEATATTAVVAETEAIYVIEQKTLRVLGPDFYVARSKYLLGNVSTKNEYKLNYL